MFNLALAFLIFAGTGFKLNSNMVIHTVESTLGSDIVITTTSAETIFLPEYELRQTLADFESKYPNTVKDFAFVSQNFQDVSGLSWGSIMSTAQSGSTAVEIYSVDESYLEAAYDQYFVPNGYDGTVTIPKLSDSGNLNVVASLYSEEGLQGNFTFDPNQILSTQNFTGFNFDSVIASQQVRIIMPKSLSNTISSGAGRDSILQFSNTQIKARIRNVATKFPGFSYSGYSDAGTNTLIISHEDFTYLRSIVWNITTSSASQASYLAEVPTNSSYNITKARLLVRLEDDVSDEKRLILFNSLQSLITGQYTFATDVYGTIKSLKNALVFIDVFFILVSIIAILLSFFFTIVAFVGNVSENLWEFGVLRAVGLTKSQMTKIYTLEALSVVIAAGILGSSVGVLVAVISTIELRYFTELPFELMFPTSVFVISIVASILTAILGSRYAVHEVKHKQIATITKGLD